METRGPYILIGSFVLIVFALAFLFILWLGSAQSEFDEYQIVFEEQVSGLNRGGAVRFSGIQVGEVQKLEINNEGHIEVLVRVDKSTPVKTDTIARLEIVGFTGLAIIQFEGGTPDAELLKDTVSGLPIIEAQPSDIGLLLSGGESIVEGVNRILSEDNIKNISGIIKNLNTLSATFAASSDDITAVMSNTAEISKELAKASDDLDRLINNIDTLITKGGNETLASVGLLAKDARTLVNDLRVVTDENGKNLKSFTENGLAQIGPGMTEVRRLMRTMNNFMKKLERDPRGYLLGEPVPEYKTKQETKTKKAKK